MLRFSFDLSCSCLSCSLRDATSPTSTRPNRPSGGSGGDCGAAGAAFSCFCCFVLGTSYSELFCGTFPPRPPFDVPLGLPFKESKNLRSPEPFPVCSSNCNELIINYYPLWRNCKRALSSSHSPSAMICRLSRGRIYALI